MNQPNSLQDIWTGFMTGGNQKQASAQTTPTEQMNKQAYDEAEDVLNKLAVAAALDMYNQRDETVKQASDFAGRLYAQAFYAGFEKAAELGGTGAPVAMQNDGVVGAGTPPSPEVAGAGIDGMKYLISKLPTVAQASDPALISQGGNQYVQTPATQKV